MKDFSINLPNGYHLDHNSNTCNVITDHESWVLINKNVDSYLTIKDFVIGHVSREKSTDNDAKELTGYFILDTKSGEIKKGMTKDILISSLNKRGIHTDLKLKQPDIFLALLSKI